MIFFHGKKMLAVVALLMISVLGACSTNPATGEQSFTAFMSPEQEKRVGAEEHPKILKEFGGAYNDPALAAYVDRIGQSLARNSELPNLGYTFTVLNSEEINAFALPGGYVYVTRGLIALADDEAELAGVLAHEIGHVTARHTAQRYSQAVSIGLGAAVLGAVIGNGAVNDVVGLGANLYLKSYSREQEFEADSLGVRYLTRGAYDNSAMASFLIHMRANSALRAKLEGAEENSVDQPDFLATHPRTIDRVQRAIAEAGTNGGTGGQRRRVDYMAAIDGLLYGDDPKEGFIRRQEFVHPKLRFRFEVPDGFRLFNSTSAVLARGPGDSAIRFDIDGKHFAGPMTSYLADIWGQNLSLSSMENITVNGMKGATGTARVRGSSGIRDLRLVAVRQNPTRIYRFLFVTPLNLTAQLAPGLQRTTYSIRPISADEADRYKPLRILIRAVKPSDTVSSFARQMPFSDFQEERFRVLNGLTPVDPLRAGQLVKTITDKEPRR